MFPFIPFRAKEPGDSDYQQTYGECRLSKLSWIRVIWRWKGWKWDWVVIRFLKKCISFHLWKLQTKIMSVTRKLYCRLTLGSFLTIQKHPASTGPPLLPWQADTHRHTHSPSPPHPPPACARLTYYRVTIWSPQREPSSSWKFLQRLRLWENKHCQIDIRYIQKKYNPEL